MPIEIRPLRETELRDYVDALSATFLERPDVDKVATELGPLWDLSRSFAAFDGERVCGSFRSWPTELTVPGGSQLSAAAVAAVTVLPTHRRRGILRRMVQAAHADVRARGEAMAILYASEYPIYGRFGYGPACRTATWTLATHETRFHGSPAGTIELAPPPSAAKAEIVRVHEAWRRRRHGEIRRRDYTWDFDLGRDSAWGPRWNGFLALHRNGGGTVDGYVRYRTEERWERGMPRGSLTVDDLHGLTDAAVADLWRFVGELDLVSTLKAEQRSPTDRLPWLLTNPRAASVADVHDGLWVRLFDLRRALEARGYAREASVVIEAIDGEAPGGRVRVALETAIDGARCLPTDRSPDLSLDIGALGAAYLGGTRLRDAVLPTGVDEHRGGALAELDGLLRTLDEPWCSTHF